MKGIMCYGNFPMRGVLVLLGLFLSAACAKAAEEPRIQFLETEYDFGVLIQGATVQHSFVFKNAGGSPLEIQSVNTSCGCTAALPANRIVDPGGRSEIAVTYDSHGKVGEVNKQVRVWSSDPKNSVVYLFVKGLVVASEHPQMTGAQTLFQGSCKTCHADAGTGKAGRALYNADCAMCHEHHRMGGKRIAPSGEEMSAHGAGYLKKAVTRGLEGTSMPAFHEARGGPLTSKQIKSLVKFIRSLKNTGARP